MSNNVTFSKQEQAPILIQATLLTFILLFWKYYQQEIILADALIHTLLFFASTTIIVLIHEAGHKFFADKVGYEATVTQYNTGILASTIIIFATFARLPLIIANPVALDADAKRRLGKHRKYENPKQYAFIAFGGTIASTISIAAFRLLQILSNNEIFAMISLVAGIHAISALIPWELLSILMLRMKNSIPETTPGDGLLIMRWHIYAWIAAITYIIVFVVLSTTGSTLAFILALLFAGLTTLVHALMNLKSH
jgi:hypothetical protein